MSITAAYLQYEVAFGDHTTNANTIRRLLADAPEFDLIVLPELAFSGYDFRDRHELHALAEPFHDGPTIGLLRKLARERQAVIIAGYAERADEGCYNAAMLVCPDGAAHNYRKIHLFNREQDVFLPGDAPPAVVETPAGRIGMMICFDWFFPETARSLALAGAQIIAHPSNLVLPWCQRAMFARSLENAVFTITANRIGTEARTDRTLTFTGGSQILNTKGETLASAPTDSEALEIATLNPDQANDKTIAGRNDRFGDRRPEMYAQGTDPARHAE
jgi:predicted amidohydrolase